MALLALAPFAMAFSQSQATLPASADRVVEKAGALSWSVLEAVEEVPTEGDRMVPKFSDKILALDGKEVTLFGFMLPLDQSERQRQFLLSAYPSHCPFCLPGGANLMVEVLAPKGVKFTFDPVTVKGRFALLKDDPSGLFYRLGEAVSLQ